MADKDTLAGWVDGPSGAVSSGAAGPDVFAGRYEILGLLGMGGMGSVYRVRDRELDEIVALKLIRRELTTPAMLGRFRQEVKLARRVTHENVVRTYDFGEHGDDRFLTMEYVDGRALSRLLEERGALPAAEAVRIGRALCSGVAAAHRAGVLHRDLKPDNVLVEGSGRVAITDFGIARAAGAEGTIGGVVGTPAYMSPEQVQGLEVDARTDIYALGAILFELLTGRRAWPGEQPFAVALARVQQPPPDPRAVRPVADGLAAVVLECLARDRDARYATADELSAALGAVEATGTLPSPVVAPVPSASATSVAVLPFRNAGQPGDGYIAEGLTEEIVDGLSASPGLRVRSLGTVLGVGAGDPREIGRKLDVQVVVEGSVRRGPEGLRISARVVNVADGFQLWGRRYDCTEREALVISDAVTKEIAASLTVNLAARDRSAASDPRVIDLYLRGRAEVRRRWDDDLEPAIVVLEEALAIAPDDANVLAVLAMARARVAFYGGREGAAEPVVLEAARVTAERAVAVAPDRGEPWLALAHAHLYAHETPSAARALRRAIENAPALGRAQGLVGYLLIEAGRLDAARPRLQFAYSEDPTTQARWDLARLHAYRGEWEACDALLEAPREITARALNAWFYRARYRTWKGAPSELDPPRIPPDAHGALLRFGRMIELLSHAVPSRLGADDVGYLRSSVAVPNRRLRTARSQFAAELFAWSGHVDEALDMIRAGVEAGLEDLQWFDHCPAIASARARPEFEPLRQVVAGRSAAIVAALGPLAG
jgi:TolB-like protein